jgi:hypothetical protein
VRITTDHWKPLIAGILLMLLGAIWALQGLGILRGSVMTGQSLWLAIGALAALLGLVLVVWSLKARAPKT